MSATQDTQSQPEDHDGDVTIIEEPPTTKPTKRVSKGKRAWTNDETAHLLEIYSSEKYSNMFSKGQVSHKIIWGQIAAELNIDTDWTACRDRFKYLKKRYKQVSSSSEKSGMSAESKEQITKDFPSYETLAKILDSQ